MTLITWHIVVAEIGIAVGSGDRIADRLILSSRPDTDDDCGGACQQHGTIDLAEAITTEIRTRVSVGPDIP